MFKDKKRGVTPFEDIVKADTPLCELGQYQALPIDYEHSSYIPLPLLPPSLVGDDIGARISTFAMTNIVPFEPAVATLWKRAIAKASTYLSTSCLSVSKAPEIYILSGTTVNDAKVNVIGNGVTVPDMIWMSACCIQSDTVSSFAIFVYNTYDQTPSLVTVSAMQELLKVEFSKGAQSVAPDFRLYPGEDDRCHQMASKVSFPI